MGDADQAGKEYETVLGYAHSTGGPVLLNYLMERGDDDLFDVFSLIRHFWIGDLSEAT